MEMECMLCLEINNNNVVNYIDIYSVEYREQDIEGLIEKHICQLDTLKSQSPWLCSTCWKTLQEFHQFCRRIEDVNFNFEYVVKSEELIEIEEYSVAEFVQDNVVEHNTVCETEISSDNTVCEIATRSLNTVCGTATRSHNLVCETATKSHNTVCETATRSDNSKNRIADSIHGSQNDVRGKCFVKPQYSCSTNDLEDTTAYVSQERKCNESITNLNSTLLKCNYCRKVLKDQGLLAKHIAWHKGNVVYCEICDLKYFDLSKLIQHKKIHALRDKTPLNHDENNTDNTNESFFTFSCVGLENGEIEEEEETNSFNQTFKCKCCSKIMYDQHVYSNHIAWHEGSLYCCKICDLQFFDLNKFESHMLVHNKNWQSKDLDQTQEPFESTTTTSAASTVDQLNINCEGGNFKCKYCSNVYEQEQAYLNHIAWHEGDIFHCAICDLKFLNASKYYSHKATHASKESISCDSNETSDICNAIEEEKYDVKQLHQKHETTTHNSKTNSTCDSNSDKDTLIEETHGDVEHLYQKHKSPHDLNINSDSCDSNSEDNDTLIEPKLEDAEHLHEEYSNHNEIECEVEEDKEEENGNAKSNVSTDLICNNFETKEVKCKLCFKVMENECALLNHTAWHKGDIFHCSICDLKFFDKSKFENHNLAHSMSNETPDSDSENNIPLEYFVCTICSKVLNSRRLFLYHNALHKKNIQQCYVCDLKFLDKYKYDAHILTHIPKSWKSCPDCGKRFSSVALVISHREKMHGEVDLKICEICGKTYRCPDSFKRHVRKHNGTGPAKVACKICGRILSKLSLKSHTLINHPEGGVLPYTCEICLKPKATRALLNRHMVIYHSEGAGDYKCPICDKHFDKLVFLKKHSEIHRAEPQYTCYWCPEKFYSSSYMSKHRKKAHPKEYAEWKKNQYVQV